MRVGSFLLGVSLLGAGCDCGSGGPSSQLPVHIEYQKETLSNGLTVLLIKDDTVPIVSYQTWMGVGSVDEERGKTGLAHLLEHLMFKGTPSFSKEAFFQELEGKGAEVNAYTTRDYTVYYATAVPERLPKIIEIESDRMANITFTQDDLDREKNVVFEERRLRVENSPSGKMNEALWYLAFQQHPYRHPVIGYPPDLLDLKLKDLQEFFKKHYTPSRATVVIAGAFDPKSTLGLIRQHYGKIKGQSHKRTAIPQEPPQNSERRIRLYDLVASHRVLQGYRISEAGHSDTYAIDVLSQVLFHGTSSRAYRRLVMEKQVVLSVGGTSYTPVHPGLFLVNLVLKGDLSFEAAEKEFQNLVFEIQDKGVTEEEVQAAVKQLTVELIDSIRTPQGMARYVGLVHSVLGDVKYYAKDLSAYYRVSAADVRRVAQKYLHPNRRSVVVMSPKSHRKTQKSEKQK